MILSRMGVNNPIFGKVVSADIRAKLSVSLKGNKNKNGNTVEVLDLTNNQKTITVLYEKLHESQE